MSVCFAGLDWASRTHVVCVIDERGAVRLKFEINHDATGLAELVRRLRGAGVTAVAIERPSGLIVDAVLEADFAVVPIHPNVVKASRPRCRSHGGKSDATDAYLLADLLRTDVHRFKPLAPQSDDLLATSVQLANQLRELPLSFRPRAVAIVADIDSPIALAFIKRYPTPKLASRLGTKRTAAFCKQHAYSGRRSAEELLERPRHAPTVTVAPVEMDAKGKLALCQVQTLSRLTERLRALKRRIEDHVCASNDGAVPMSFPRAGRINDAQLLSELGNVRERFANGKHLAAEAGVAPVTYASGQSKAVTFRWACNHRLRRALTSLADNSRHASDWATSVCAKARARGCDHPHAIRILARAWQN